MAASRPLHPQASLEGSERARSIPIGVADTVPVYRSGLLAGLREAGYEAVSASDALSWADQQGRRALVLCVRNEQDWKVVSLLACWRPRLALLAVLPSSEVGAYGRALRCGASAVVSFDAPISAILSVLVAAIEGNVLLPLNVVTALLRDGCDRPMADHGLTRQEVDWLRILAQGVPVNAIARSSGYSERTMHRLLARVYRRLGASNRIEAIATATRWELIQSA